MRVSRSPLSRRARRAATLVVACLASLAIVVPGANAAAASFGTFLGSGSDVTLHVMSSLDLLYNESPGCNYTTSGSQPLDFACIPQPSDVTTENPNHNIFTEAFPIGGSAGVNQLCQQNTANVAKIDYARTTTGPSVSTCSGVSFVAFARDALSWEAFPNVAGSAVANLNNQAGSCAGSTGFCLTQAQLQGIFVTCSITNWNQVGGANAAIKVYTIASAYATRGAWDKFIGGNSGNCAGSRLIAQTHNEQIPDADKPFAIVPVSVGSWTERYGVGEVTTGGTKSTKTTIKEVTKLVSKQEVKITAAKPVKTCSKAGGAKKKKCTTTYTCPKGATKVKQGSKFKCRVTTTVQVPVTTTTTDTQDVVDPGTQTAVEPSALGAIDGLQPKLASIQNGTFPFTRYLYNAYCSATNCGTATQAPQQVVDYLGPDGWLCRSAAHADDPTTGTNYRKEIEDTIVRFGFAPIPLGPTGGGNAGQGYCRLTVSP